MNIDFWLSELGHEKIYHVIEIVFAHIVALKKYGLQEQVTQYLNNLKWMKFDGAMFESKDLVSKMSKLMNYLDDESMSDVVPLSLEVPEFSTEQLNQYYNYLAEPSNLMIFVSADFDNTLEDIKTEKWK